MSVPPCARIGVFLAAVALGNKDRRRKAAAPGGEGHGLAVVSARGGDQAASCRLALHEFLDVNDRGAGFERVRGGVVLVFHPESLINSLMYALQLKTPDKFT
jgi:hypothetical protein